MILIKKYGKTRQNYQNNFRVTAENFWNIKEKL